MKSIASRAVGVLLAAFSGFALAAPPQLLVPSELGDGPKTAAMWSGAPSVSVPGFVTPGVRARFNAPELLGLKHGDAMELTLPDASRHSFVLDLVEAHPDGIRTLFARHQDHGNKHRVIVTSGPTGSFAVFSTPQGEFRLVPTPDGDVLIDMGAESQFIPPLEMGHDVRISPVEEAKAASASAPTPFQVNAGVTSLPMTKAAPATGNIVDIMFVITPGLAANLGADLLTRLQFLVARANASYADSDVAIRLRYVHHLVLAAYSDATDTGVALSEITPGCAGGPGFCDAPFNAAVFGTIETLRTTHGADVVAMLLNGNNTGGNGIAWLGSRNAGSTAITNPTFLYSATTGCVRGCESVFIHEVGHNFGLNHDRATWAWQAGGVAPPSSTLYNFGYYFCQTGALSCNPNTPGSCTSQPECSDVSPGPVSPNNFADLMAYFHQSTESNYRFSNPLVNCDGNRASGGTSRACGAADADASRYLNEVRAALSAVKAVTGGKPDTYTDGSSSVTGWPPGGTLPSGFTSTGNPWTVVTSPDRVFEGTHSLRSARVFGTTNTVPVLNQATFANSDLVFTGTFTAGTLSFMYNVSSLSFQGVGGGFIEFSIDGLVVLSDTGESGWQFFSYPITAGAHTLQWRFKNAWPAACNVNPMGPGGVNCADRAWIDAVSLPLATVSSATSLTSSLNPSTAGQAVTITAGVVGSSGTPTGTVTFQNGGVNMSGCVALALAAGAATCITSALPPGANSIVGMYSGNSTYSASSSTPLVQTVNAGAQLFTASPATLAFGGQSMNTTSASMTSTITNTVGASRTITGIAATTGYTVTHNCPATAMAPLATCTVTVTFTPPAGPSTGPHNGVVSIVYAGGGPTVVNLTGTAERSLVSHYYRSILRRAPDAGGKTFWEGEATRVGVLGANVNETWYAMAQAFFFSGEYAAFARNNTGFVTDLYTTFFNRAPDAGGLTFWVGQLTSGMPREVALSEFLFSAEFRTFTQAIFGSAGVRAEVDAVTDFYRGLLARLPDDGGFNFWIGRFRTAQCQNAAAVTAQVEAISSAFAVSGEYTARARSGPQYVGDLYNAFLRRGGDLGGVQFWISQVPPGPQTREQVRVAFRNSAEFQARVNAIIAQGCL